ncbi:MAG: HAD-IIB family hydrolase, partial [Vulcanimicrobiaceae bacterium]
MRFHAVAVDFDGTLAHDGAVSEEALEALRCLRKSGRRPILATGRIVDRLAAIFPHLGLFDAVVAENGAVLFDPVSGRQEALVEPPPRAFVERLEAKRVPCLEVGRVIVATRQPHEATVLETIRELGLEIGLTFNKGAVMALPSGVTKASGLARQLELFKLSFHNVLGIGDAENDLGFLSRCEASAAVANALPSVKETCDIVASLSHGRGVCEVIEQLLADDLQSIEAIERRHRLPIGKIRDGQIVDISVACPNILVAGMSGGGKSTLVSGFIEHVGESGYQYCVIDPEGDFAEMKGAIPVGDAKSEPSLETVGEVLLSGQNAIISLLAIKPEDRSSYARRLVGRIAEVRTQYGRPHWTVIDEAHHLFPAQAKPQQDPYDPGIGTMFVTTQPSLVSREALQCVHAVIAVGEDARKTVEEARELLGVPRGPLDAPKKTEAKHALLWRRQEPEIAIDVET